MDKEAEEQRVLDEKAALDAEQQLLDVNKEVEEVGEEPIIVTKIPRQLPPAPVIQYEEVPECPPELPGTGVNKKVFFT